MMSFKWRAAVSTFSLAFAALATPAAAQLGGLEIGSQAPTPKVETLGGKTVDLARYVGKRPTLIEFWATWCPSCHELEPAMKKAHARWGKQVQFVGIAVSANQSPEKVKRWQAKHPFPGVLFYDKSGDATGVFDVPGTSHVVVLDAKGRVVYTGSGGKQDLEGAIRKAVAAK